MARAHHLNGGRPKGSLQVGPGLKQIKGPAIGHRARASLLEEKYHVIVPPTATDEQLADILVPYILRATRVMDELRATPTHLNGELVAKYAALLGAMQELRASLLAHGCRPVELGNLQEADYKEMKEAHAYNLSTMLTKLEKGLAFADEIDPDGSGTKMMINPETHLAYNWVDQAMLSLLARSTTLIRKWSGLLKHERIRNMSRDEVGEDLMGAYRKTVSAKEPNG